LAALWTTALEVSARSDEEIVHDTLKAKYKKLLDSEKYPCEFGAGKLKWGTIGKVAKLDKTDDTLKAGVRLMTARQKDIDQPPTGTQEEETGFSF